MLKVSRTNDDLDCSGSIMKTERKLAMLVKRSQIALFIALILRGYVSADS